MERFSQREHVLLGYSPQRSFENSAKTSDANSEMDFSDVFGGPPRLSIQETRARYSFTETRVDSEEDTVLPRSPWSGLDEKPVFGVENAKRSPYQSDDFFDDIFKGDEAKSRRNSRDFFATSPGSRILSPSKPLPPIAEPFSPSFPAQFSLPAKLTKATDFALFGSTNRSPYKNKDGNSNGISHEHTSNHSRFANQATDVKDETRNDRSFYHPSPLSHEVSHHNSEEPSFKAKSDGKEMGAKMKNSSENKVTPLNSDQFHFSIYKWPGSGVPLLMHLGGRNRSRFKERFKTERCSSSNGRIESDSTKMHLPNMKDHTISLDTESVYLKINNDKHDESSNKEKIEPCNDAGEVHIKIPELNFIQNEEHAIPQGEVIPTNKTEKESQSKGETSVGGKNEKETNLNKGQAPKAEQKPLSALLNEENQRQGNTAEGKENKVRVTNEVNMNAGAKKTDGKGINSNRTDAIKTCTQSSTTYSGNAFGRSSTKGKVSEFVKIFNRETSAKSKTDLGNQGSRWKGMDTNGTENGMSNAVKSDYKVHKFNKNKMTEAFSREDDSFNKNKVKLESHFNSSAHKTSNLSTDQKNASIVSDSCPSENDKVESRTESFHAYFQVEELTQVDDKTSGDSEDIKASTAKIQQWSSGRKGNIRSLLSTLQFVLWPESGWKPVPLVDLIEGSAIKRAYQRALLCLHPDKLQQKGAASHQKYIAEQVFDILQEAWDHFNSLGAI